MIICTVDRTGRVLTVSYSRHVGTTDTRRCIDTVEDLLHRLKPGFILLSDLTHLDSMDPECAHDIGTLMDLCGAGGLTRVHRVMPDPSKDIGFNIITRFHHQDVIRTDTHETLADALSSILMEHAELPHADAA